MSDDRLLLAPGGHLSTLIVSFLHPADAALVLRALPDICAPHAEKNTAAYVVYHASEGQVAAFDRSLHAGHEAEMFIGAGRSVCVEIMELAIRWNPKFGINEVEANSALMSAASVGDLKAMRLAKLKGATWLDDGAMLTAGGNGHLAAMAEAIKWHYEYNRDWGMHYHHVARNVVTKDFNVNKLNCLLLARAMAGRLRIQVWTEWSLNFLAALAAGRGQKWAQCLLVAWGANNFHEQLYYASLAERECGAGETSICAELATVWGGTAEGARAVAFEKCNTDVKLNLWNGVVAPSRKTELAADCRIIAEFARIQYETVVKPLVAEIVGGARSAAAK